MNKPVLILDKDDVLFRFAENWLARYTFESKHKLTKEQLVDWDIAKFVLPNFRERIYDILTDKQISNIIFKSCVPYENAVEVSEWLQDYFDVWIVTATHYNNFAPSVEQIQKYYPHIPTDHICALTDKILFKADYIVDDKHSTVCQFKHGILFHQPWNAKYDYHPRVHNWLEIKAYFQRLINLGIINKEGVA